MLTAIALPECPHLQERFEHLLQKEGIPFRLADDEVTQLRGELGHRQHARREPEAVVVGQRPQPYARRVGALLKGMLVAPGR